MKHLILLILALLCICTMAAQDSYFTPSSKNKTKIEEEASKNIDNFFNTSEWDKDYAELVSYSGGNTSRAKKIMAMGKMNEEKAIQWQYVIFPKREGDSIDIKMFMEALTRWQKQMFTAESVVKEKTDHSITYEWNSPNAAYTTGYMSATSISIRPSIIVEVKPERFRVTGIVRHYIMGSANLNGPSSKVYAPGDMYPFTQSKHKNSCTQAFINSNVRLTNTMQNLFSFLNTKYREENKAQKQEENW